MAGIRMVASAGRVPVGGCSHVPPGSQAANASRHWPTGRGIFHNKEKTFLVWVGEEDHLRIISMAMGGDVGKVFQLLIDGIQHMDSLMSFSSDPRLGWLTFCPTNLGTAIRASVHIKLPLLARGGMETLQEVADRWQLQVGGRCRCATGAGAGLLRGTLGG